MQTTWFNIRQHTGSFEFKHSQRWKLQITELCIYIHSVNGLHHGILPSSFITQPLIPSFIDTDIYDSHLCPQNRLWGNQVDLWPLDTRPDQPSPLSVSGYKSKYKNTQCLWILDCQSLSNSLSLLLFFWLIHKRESVPRIYFSWSVYS